ncbi:MAG: glycosyltransferase [Thermoplasmatales archaeon]
MQLQKGVSIVTATFNERENIPLFLKAIEKVMAGFSYEVIVVDDNSKDGTVDFLLREKEKNERLKVLINRKREGLLKSNMMGLMEAKGEIRVVMDADLQHPPESIPDMLDCINGKDAVIMSRFVPGSMLDDFDPTRRIVTDVAIFLCHSILPETRRFSDPLSGFFAIGENINVPYDPIGELFDGKRGFKTLIPIILSNAGKNIIEMPFSFHKRNWGRSKLVWDNIPIPRYLMELSAYRAWIKEA